MKIIYFFSFLFFYHTFFSHQTYERGIDSLEQLMQKTDNPSELLSLEIERLKEVYRNNDVLLKTKDSLCDNAISLLIKSNFDRINYVDLFLIKSRILIRSSRHIEAYSLLDDFLVDSARINKREILDILYYQGSSLYEQNQFLKAVKIFHQASVYTKYIDDKRIKRNYKTSIFYNLGLCQSMIGDNRSALNSFLYLYNQKKDHSKVYWGIVYSYTSLEEIDSAIYYAEEYEHKEPITKENMEFYTSYANLLVNHLNKFRKAEKILKTVMSINELDTLAMGEGMGAISGNLANLYIKEMKLEEGDFYLKKALLYTEKLGDSTLKKDLYTLLIELYTLKNEPDSSYKYFLSFYDISNYLDSINQYEVIKELEVKYKTKQKAPRKAQNRSLIERNSY